VRRRAFGLSWLATYAALAALFLILPELVVVSFNPTSRMVMSWSSLSGR
jgi:hypothetical protein